jgi:hypothetical protein
VNVVTCIGFPSSKIRGGNCEVWLTNIEQARCIIFGGVSLFRNTSYIRLATAFGVFLRVYGYGDEQNEWHGLSSFSREIQDRNRIPNSQTRLERLVWQSRRISWA